MKVTAADVKGQSGGLSLRPRPHGVASSRGGVWPNLGLLRSRCCECHGQAFQLTHSAQVRGSACRRQHQRSGQQHYVTSAMQVQPTGRWHRWSSASRQDRVVRNAGGAAQLTMLVPAMWHNSAMPPAHWAPCF